MKLHELLAVETSLENQTNQCRFELSNTFEKKRHLFEGKNVTFYPVGEGAPVEETQLGIQTTVEKELTWIKGFIKKSLDASYQVAETNTIARADVVLDDGTVLVKDLPATALLELEKRMAELHNFVKSIPTLDPAKGFILDEAQGKGIYKAREIKKERTKKTKVVLIRYEATKEHPAQTELVDQDVPTGKIEEKEWSGLITPAQKADYINKVEVVTRAVRQARSRANEAEVDNSKKIGDKLLSYIFG